MATHSSPLALKIPWTEEPGRLQSMGSQRVGRDWATLLSYCFTLLWSFLLYKKVIWLCVHIYPLSLDHIIVVMWVMKIFFKAEHQRIDVFELWCWRRLLRVPRTARRSNQSILKETSPEYLLEGLILKLKNCNTLATWCEGLTHWKRPWCWEWLKQGGEGDDKGWDGWMASLTRWIWVWASSGC